MVAGQSPASSPRLPSPPPMAEDQLGPASPGALFDVGLSSVAGVDNGASRRIRPGTKAEDMAEGPPLVELSEIDSAFPLTEHLKALHRSKTYDSANRTTSPITAESARELATPPPGTSRDIWLYELGRFLIQKTNSIIVGLFSDEPACSAQTCSEMRASEWQYLCAVHDPPKSCSAIDYCCHTLDWASTTLTSPKIFPSRLGLGSGNAGYSNGGNDKVLLQQMKELTNIFRRVYRIYAHAWFQHREVFWKVEGRTGLYRMFKTVCDIYGLIQPENYTIPPEAEGLEEEETGRSADGKTSAPILLKRDLNEVTTPQAMELPIVSTADHLSAGSDTTKRHRHTKSDHVKSLTTVIQEEAEEEEEASSKPSLDRSSTVLKKDTPEALQPLSSLTNEPLLDLSDIDGVTDSPAPAEDPATDESEITVIHDDAEEPKDPFADENAELPASAVAPNETEPKALAIPETASPLISDKPTKDEQVHAPSTDGTVDTLDEPQARM